MKAYHGLTQKVANALLLFPVLLCLGCANLTETLFVEQKYLLVDAPITEKPVVIRKMNGTAYSIPEKKLIRRIRIFGEGRVSNVQIYVRRSDDAFGGWKLVKDFKGLLDFPVDVPIVTSGTDSVAIIQRTARRVASKKGWKSTGQIHRVEFYAFTPEPTD